MKLGTRLLLPLLATVALVMSLFAAWALRQRQATLVAEARNETWAYATALGLALEGAFRDPELSDVQEIIDRISQQPKIYGVLVYGPDGRALFVSRPLEATDPAPAAVLRSVLASGDTASFEREIAGQAVYSVLRPIVRPDGLVAGAFEVAQPLSFVEAEKARTTQRFLLNTLTLLAAVTVVILWLVRRSIARPLGSFLEAVQALGRGELKHRVAEGPGGGEVALLAQEFNRMAGHLEQAQADLMHSVDERIALERRLRETEKLAAVGNLAAGLAHEVAAPLHVIRGRAEMLLRRGELEGGDERNLRIIIDQIQRITMIVRNLLDYARRREPRIELLDLAQVIEGVAEFLESELARAGIHLEWEGPKPLWIRGDPHLLHQVFINLLINARQALESLEGDRRIVIRARTDGMPGAAPDRRWIIVEVEDTGPGIPDDAFVNIFEPFFTTKPGGDGTGLGLAVARSIVEEHGGQLVAENVLDPQQDGGLQSSRRGARFRLTIPAAAPAEPVHA
ncbi:MAG: HAMP domain-containing histidine kinase [Gemmatimonadetes bacterium]|nr:HAMP domain-containing histidine kinase [Gemmatimonadota bacterium]